MGVRSPRGREWGWGHLGGREWEWRWGHLGVGSKSGGGVT